MKQSITNQEMTSLIDLTGCDHPDMDIMVNDMLDHFYAMSDEQRQEFYSRDMKPSFGFKRSNHFSYIDFLMKGKISKHNMVILKDRGYRPWIIVNFNIDNNFVARTHPVFEKSYSKHPSTTTFSYSDIIIPTWALPSEYDFVQYYIKSKRRFMNDIERLCEGIGLED